jgi:hypothetical protein
MLLVLAVAVSACGGSDPKATDDPTETASVTQTPTPTPTPTPTQAPLSPFEGKAPVKAARAWADALGRAVNSNTFTAATLGQVATPAGVKASETVTRLDTSHGYQWPGPMPFTPVNVRAGGGTARIAVCTYLRGWAIDPKTGKLATPNKVGPAMVVMKHTSNGWLFEALQVGSADCSGVVVTGVKW